MSISDYPVISLNLQSTAPHHGIFKELLFLRSTLLNGFGPSNLDVVMQGKDSTNSLGKTILHQNDRWFIAANLTRLNSKS